MEKQMEKQIAFSEVPVGASFRYEGESGEYSGMFLKIRSNKEDPRPNSIHGWTGKAMYFPVQANVWQQEEPQTAQEGQEPSIYQDVEEGQDFGIEIPGCPTVWFRKGVYFTWQSSSTHNAYSLRTGDTASISLDMPGILSTGSALKHVHFEQYHGNLYQETALFRGTWRDTENLEFALTLPISLENPEPFVAVLFPGLRTATNLNVEQQPMFDKQEIKALVDAAPMPFVYRMADAAWYFDSEVRRLKAIGRWTKRANANSKILTSYLRLIAPHSFHYERGRNGNG